MPFTKELVPLTNCPLTTGLLSLYVYTAINQPAVANDIHLYQEDDHIIIQIEAIEGAEKPTATIISNSGETLMRYELKQGKNTIHIARFQVENCSVRIQSGRNVLVKKIER